MDEYMNKTHFDILSNSASALAKNGFKAKVFDNKEKAAKFISRAIGKNKKAGFGGTMTAEEMNLKNLLSGNGNEIITHLPEMNKKERFAAWFAAQKADFYFASPQAITRKGEMIFIDGTGNRAASVIYGPGKVVLIAGRNKIVKDLEEGIWRMRNIAAIPNNIRLNKNNPCVKEGHCVDCSSPERICNAVTILLKKPKFTEYLVILVNEELGY